MQHSAVCNWPGPQAVQNQAGPAGRQFRLVRRRSARTGWNRRAPEMSWQFLEPVELRSAPAMEELDLSRRRAQDLAWKVKAVAIVPG